MTERQAEKTCKDCRCSDCSQLTALADRVDAWQTAKSNLFTAYKESDQSDRPSPVDILILAHWLYYGTEYGESDND